MLKHERHWEIIKIITKQSIKLDKGIYLIKQNMIDVIKKHPNEIKEILKKLKKAETNWRRALEQFNSSITDEEVDECILKLIEGERDFQRAINFANETLKGLLWKQNNN